MHLHHAAKDSDVSELSEQIARLFSEFPDTGSRIQVLGKLDKEHLTPLHYAVKYGNDENVKLLLQKGADVNVRAKYNTTPLHYAARYTKLKDDLSLLQLLIHSGADVNAQDDALSTPLHYACMGGNERVVKELLKVDGINTQAVDQLKTTPLHMACAVGSIEVIDLLIEHDVDLMAETKAQMTPMHIACSQGHEKLLDYLLTRVESKHGISTLQKVLHIQNNEGQALAHLAVLASHIKVLKNLLERGADVNQLMDEEESVLHIAAVTGNKEIVKLLLAHDVEVDKKNTMGRTALHKAARFGKHRVVDMLIKRGADVNVRDDNQLTPLFLALNSSSNSRTIQYLLNNNANIEARDKEDRTVLHLAVLEENVKGVKTLLQSNQASKIINLKDKDSNTALHIACARGYEEIAILMLATKADVQSRNNESKTPLHLAAFYGQDDVVDNILEINASTINDFDDEGNSPLHLAARNGHQDVIKYLLKSGASVNDRNTALMTSLDCAAFNGKTEAVKVLIWGGASVLPSNENGFSPLHLSCMEGNSETVKELLKHSDISLTDANGQNALDLAIDHLNKDAALALLNHRDWKDALRNKTIEENRVTTPVRKMIRRMPELAQHTFNRCIETNDKHPSEHEDYSVTFTYEFLDDVYKDWPCDLVRKDTMEGRGKGDLYTKAKLQKEMEMKESHTFSHMVHYKRRELLSHPLCLSMIERKWHQFAIYLYYFKLILYTFFLTVLTGYILVSAPLREPYRADDCTITIQNETLSMTLFVMIGKFWVLLLALIHLAFEVIQMIGQRLDYLAVDNLLEWIVYLLAIANVIDDFVQLPLSQAGFVCGPYQKSVGAVSVFLAWVNFILFIRKVPLFGIYIVMFLYIIKTFFKFFVVFIFLIIAFGLSFFVLLHDEESIPSFDSPISALIKTGVMMTGELNFDDFFFADHKPLLVTWILFILFILIMVIVLMNLLVGLAVDDIQEVQKQAEITKATMQIDICLDSERSLPKMIRKYFIASDQDVFVNDPSRIPPNVHKDLLAAIRTIVRKDKAPIDQLQDGLKNLQKNLAFVESRVLEIDEQLSELSGVEGKLNDLKSMMTEVLKYQQRRRVRKPKPADGSQKPVGDSEARDEATSDDAI